VRLPREDGARFGKSSKGWFFGFKLHAVRHIAVRVMHIILTPANWDDRDPAPALQEGVGGGITIADLGSRGPECAASLEEAEVLLITRADAPDSKFLLSQVRRYAVGRLKGESLSRRARDFKGSGLRGVVSWGRSGAGHRWAAFRGLVRPHDDWSL
jgi:hypothetical protein